MLWPQLVVFDLDHTLWHRPRFRGGPPWTAVNDGLGGVRSSTGEVLDLYPASRLALLELAGAGVPVAVASRTHRPAWALLWLSLLPPVALFVHQSKRSSGTTMDTFCGALNRIMWRGLYILRKTF